MLGKARRIEAGIVAADARPSRRLRRRLFVLRATYSPSISEPPRLFHR